MNAPHGPKPVTLAFELQRIRLSLSSLRPSKTIPDSVWKSAKYLQILSSVKAIGLVEPIVVKQHPAEAGAFLVLDGHVRLHALRSCEIESTECLVSLDDESFTYNRHHIGMTPVTMHKMIAKALDHNVSAEALAEALGYSVDVIKARFRLLHGICSEAADILADKRCALAVFDVLRKMKPLRQIEAAMRMVDFGNYSLKFANAMLEASAPNEIVEGAHVKRPNNGQVETNARLEREVASLHEETRHYEQNFSKNNLELMFVQTYLQTLLADAKVVLWLSENRPDYLREFKKIADIKILA
jgi:hypothetical protein